MTDGIYCFLDKAGRPCTSVLQIFYSILALKTLKEISDLLVPCTIKLTLVREEEYFKEGTTARYQTYLLIFYVESQKLAAVMASRLETCLV